MKAYKESEAKRVFYHHLQLLSNLVMMTKRLLTSPPGLMYSKMTHTHKINKYELFKGLSLLLVSTSIDTGKKVTVLELDKRGLVRCAVKGSAVDRNVEHMTATSDLCFLCRHSCKIPSRFTSDKPKIKQKSKNCCPLNDAISTIVKKC